MTCCDTLHFECVCGCLPKRLIVSIQGLIGFQDVSRSLPADAFISALVPAALRGWAMAVGHQPRPNSRRPSQPPFSFTCDPAERVFSTHCFLLLTFDNDPKDHSLSLFALRQTVKTVTPNIDHVKRFIEAIQSPAAVHAQVPRDNDNHATTAIIIQSRTEHVQQRRICYRFAMTAPGSRRSRRGTRSRRSQGPYSGRRGQDEAVAIDLPRARTTPAISRRPRLRQQPVSVPAYLAAWVPGAAVQE